MAFEVAWFWAKLDILVTRISQKLGCQFFWHIGWFLKICRPLGVVLYFEKSSNIPFFAKKNEENHCSITCIFCLCNISKTLISGIYWGYDFSFLECRPVCRMPTILIKKCRMPTAFKIPGIMTSILVVTYKGEMEEEGNQPPTQHANYHKMTGLVWCM